MVGVGRVSFSRELTDSQVHSDNNSNSDNEYYIIPQLSDPGTQTKVNKLAKQVKKRRTSVVKRKVAQKKLQKRISKRCLERGNL